MTMQNIYVYNRKDKIGKLIWYRGIVPYPYVVTYSHSYNRIFLYSGSVDGRAVINCMVYSKDEIKLLHKKPLRLYRKEARQMIVYKINVLQELKHKGYSTYVLRRDRIMGEAQIQKIRQGELASKETLNTICRLLQIQPGDLLEYVEEI